ncbi:MAG: serpin family protein [Chloroflexi bacterium]|nr:serpin family protein [Chloroflexota bacterium]
MRQFYRPLLMLILLALLPACAGPMPAASGGSQKVLRSEKRRAAVPEVPEADLEALADGNAAFALDLYHRLAAAADDNLFYSPYSISLALAMTYAGARGETEQAMASALHFTLPQDQLHPAFNALDQELASRKKEGGEGFRLNIVNDIWGQQDFTFLQEYLDLLSTNYGAGLRLMDFKTDPNAARQEINDYIAEQTEQRIKDLLPDGFIEPDTRLVLTNAIYFNAAWAYKFAGYLTQDAPFTLLDGSQVDVPMMRFGEANNLQYAAGEGFQAVALPYEGLKLSMLLLVPDEGAFEDFEAALDQERLDSILDSMERRQVHLSMPKFEFDASFGLKDTLAALGMGQAFTSSADFSGMTGDRDLQISDVVHKAFVKVDENGTEAAAATAVGMRVMGMPVDQVIELTVDRPFIFFIRDDFTGAVLFAGRITKP